MLKYLWLALMLTGCGGSSFTFADPQPLEGGDELVTADAGPPREATAAQDAAPPREATARDAGQPEAATTPADAAPEAAAMEAAAPICLSTLNDVGTADFRISFTVTTTGTTALVNQRAGCNETSVWWQALINSGGSVTFNTCDGAASACATVTTSHAVNDGLPHRVVLERASGVLSCSSDGVAGSTAPDAYSFGAFGAPMTIGTDECGDTPLAGHGTLTDLCVSVGGEQ